MIRKFTAVAALLLGGCKVGTPPIQQDINPSAVSKESPENPKLSLEKRADLERRLAEFDGKIRDAENRILGHQERAARDPENANHNGYSKPIGTEWIIIEWAKTERAKIAEKLRGA